MVTKEEVIKCFEEIFSKHYGRPDYTLRVNKSSETVIEKFLDYLNGVNGDKNSLFEFTVFNFHRYEGKKTNNVISISWIYGGKAIKSYQDRTEGQLYYVSLYKNNKSITNPFLEKYELKLNGEFKERERRRWFNRVQGFLNCVEFSGELFDESCRTCIECDYKEKCKTIKTRKQNG